MVYGVIRSVSKYCSLYWQNVAECSLHSKEIKIW